MTELPQGWDRARLSSVCQRVQKIDPVVAGRSRIRYVDIGSIDGSRHLLRDVRFIPAADAPGRARQVVREGDTVFSTVRPYLEKIAYIGHHLDDEFASTGFCVLRPGPGLHPAWLFRFATSRQLLDQVLPHQRGVSYPAVRDKDVLDAHIPLPSLDEQRRIVDVLEGHLSRLDAARDYLRASRRRVASLDAAILNGSGTGDRVALGELALHAGYGTSTKCIEGGPGAPVVRIPNLVGGRIDLASEKRAADPGADLRALMLERDDLLIVRTNGSRALIGRTAVVQPGITAAFASYLIRYKLDPGRVRAPWASLMLSSPGVRATLEALAASSAGQYNLGLAKLNRVRIPVPALAAQDRVLAQLHEQHDATSRLAVKVQRSEAQADGLQSALVAAAFSGRL